MICKIVIDAVISVSAVLKLSSSNPQFGFVADSSSVNNQKEMLGCGGTFGRYNKIRECLSKSADHHCTTTSLQVTLYPHTPTLMISCEEPEVFYRYCFLQSITNQFYNYLYRQIKINESKVVQKQLNIKPIYLSIFGCDVEDSFIPSHLKPDNHILSTH